MSAIHRQRVLGQVVRADLKRSPPRVANWSASSAADGTSTMMPASMRGASSRCRSSSRMARAARHSSSVATIGNMTATLPSREAPRIARSCARSSSGRFKQHADAALSQKRIVLARKRQVRQRLVAANVERPYDQPPPAPERARDVAVNGQLLLLGGGCRPMKEQKLRAKKADGLCAESDAPVGRRPARRCSRPPRRVGRRASSPARGRAPAAPGAGATDSPGTRGCARCQRSTGSGAACLCVPSRITGVPLARSRARGRCRPRAEYRAIARVSRRATKRRPSSCTARAPGRDSTRLCRKASVLQQPGSCSPRNWPARPRRRSASAARAARRRAGRSRVRREVHSSGSPTGPRGG